MTEFKLSPASIRRALLRNLLFSTTVLLIVCAVAVGIPAVQSKSKSTKGLMFFVPFTLLCLGIGVRRGWRLQVEQLEGFRIRMTEDSITRETPGLPPISIARCDITRIERDPSDILTIHATGSNNPLHLPPGISDYPNLLAQLERWQPIEPGPRKQSRIRTLLIFMLVLSPAALFAVVLLAKERILVTVCSIVLIGILIACYLSMTRSKQADSRLRRYAFLGLLPIITLVGRIYFLWAYPGG